MNIEDYIPTGRENAVSRAELALRTGLPDRTNRREIEKARRKMIPILASDDGGYYITYDVAEIERFLRKIDARERALFYTFEPLRNLVRMKKGITVTVVREHTRRIGKIEPDENQMKMSGVG